MKKILSLLLVVCMMLPMVALLPIPALAATAEDEILYSTSFVDNIPTMNGSAPAFHGAWSFVGYTPGAANYQNYTSVNAPSGWAGTLNGFTALATTSKAATGGWISVTCSHANYMGVPGCVGSNTVESIAIRYTAEYTGTVNISYDKLGQMAADSKGTFTYYIYKNGVKIWPLNGETNTINGINQVNSGKTSFIYDTKTQVASNISVSVGDVIDFICEGNQARDPWGNGGNAMFATIDYVPEKAPEAGSVIQSSAYTDNLPTQNGGAPAFHGDWSVVGYAPNTYNKPANAGKMNWAGTQGDYNTLATNGGTGFVSLGNTNANYHGAIGTVGANSTQSIAVRYTAPEAGFVNISFDKLGQLASASAGTFTYYVYVDGVKVWPADATTPHSVEGPNALNASKTAILYDKKTTVATGIRVSVGSVIDFICEGTSAGTRYGDGGNALFGRVEYTEILPYVTAFPGKDGEHIPVLSVTGTVTNADGTTSTKYSVSQPGNWAAVMFPRGYYSNPTAANLMNTNSALVSNQSYTGISQSPQMSEIWADKAQMVINPFGGVNANYYPAVGTLMVSNLYSAGLRYTAEKSGVIDINFDKLGNFVTVPFYDGTARSNENFRYGIFVNGEMVWPVKGGTLAATEPLPELQNSFVKAVKGLEVRAGDIIDFICEGVNIASSTSDNKAGCWDGAGNLIYPQVEYTTVYKSNLSIGITLGNQFSIQGILDPTDPDAFEAGVIIDGEKLVGVKQTDGSYLVEGPVFNAKNIVDEITIQGYYVKPYIGGTTETVYDAEETISIAKLLATLAGSTDKTLSKYSALAAATLEYAAMAQLYFGYETDNLANADVLSDNDVKGTYDPAKLFTVVANPASANIIPSEASLLLRDTVGLHFKFKTRDGSVVDMTGYQLQIASDAAFTNSAAVDIVEGNGYYKAEMLGIAAANWNASFFFRVVDADGNIVSPTFTYGVSAYYARMNANDDVADLVKSMMLVHEAIKTQAGGSTMDANNDAMIPNATTGTEVSITSAELAAALQAGTLEAGKVYVVSGGYLDLSGVKTANGNGAIIKLTSSNTLNITGFTGTMRNLTILAAVDLSSCSSATFVNVEIVSPSGITALIVKESSDDVELQECRITGGAYAIKNSASKLTVYHCYLQSNIAIEETSSASEALYEDCVIYGKINIAANDTSIRYSTIHGSIVATGAQNLLVGGCHFAGKSDSITFNQMHNSVILLNDITGVTVNNSTSIYVSNNSIYGALLFDNCKHLVVEDNSLHTAKAELVSCASYVGSDVTDINKRNDFSVYTPLLPQIDEDAHINMIRKTYVRAIEGEVELSVYVNNNLKSGRALMVNPGAYLVTAGGGKNKIKLENVENADLFAYGVLYERETIYSASFEAYNCKNVGIYGIAFSFPQQTSGQMYVVQKLGNNQVKCLVGAGVVKSWNNNAIAKHESAYRNNLPYSYSDVGASGDVTFDSNGFATVTYPAWQYEQMQVGDVITCRRADSLTYIYQCDSLMFEDVAVLGGTVRCFWDDYAEAGTILNRVIDKPMPSKVITKAEYDKYIAYENQYGVDLGVWIDARGNYRGSASRTATADFAHSSASKTGFTVTNCIVSGLSDDGTNNQGYKHRVTGFNPTTGNLFIEDDDSWGYGLVEAETKDTLSRFAAGEEIVIYTSTGEHLATTTVLQDFNPTDGQYSGYFKVDSSRISAAVSEKINNILSGNVGYAGDYKILMHSNDRKCNGVTFDNVLFENIRSRGALVKGSDITIKNCSFYNIGMAAIGMNFELRYGESGYVNNVTIKDNYFENTGYFDNYTYYAPISVDSPAVKGDDAYLMSSNIIIEGNVIRNRGTSNAIFLRGVSYVTIKDNDFGYSQTGSTVDVYAMFINNLTLSGNVYSSGDAYNSVTCTNYRNVTGSDACLYTGASDPLMSLTADAYEENRTTYNGSSVTHHGNWTVGYMSTATNYKTYNYTNVVSGSNYLTSLQFFTGAQSTASTDQAWNPSGYGSIGTIIRDFRFNPSNSYAVAYCYTMPKAATEVRLSISTFFPPYANTTNVGGNDDGLFAIFVKSGSSSKMVWPTNNGAWATANAWKTITQSTSQAELNASLSSKTLSLKAGDQIFFVAKRKTTGSSANGTMFAAVPVVYYN